MKILVVDNDAISRIKLVKILSAYGVCDQSADGRDAFQRFRKAMQIGEPYDLITLDVTMPGISGRETLRMIRDWERTLKSAVNTPLTHILVVSIHGDQETAISMLGETGDAYIVKPVSPEKMRKAFEIMKLDVFPDRTHENT